LTTLGGGYGRIGARPGRFADIGWGRESIGSKLEKLEGGGMANIETKEKTSQLIIKKFHVPPDYAGRLAVAALNGIDSHGGDPEDWETIVRTVDVVVKSWIKLGALAKPLD
jgi:hypothetical protein